MAGTPKLYRVQLRGPVPYDWYEGMIVCTACEMQAMSHHPNGEYSYSFFKKCWTDGEGNAVQVTDWVEHPSVLNLSVEDVTNQKGVLYASIRPT